MMGPIRQELSKTFNDFFDFEKSSGFLLIACTLISILITSSSIGPDYMSFWQRTVGGLSLQNWINDALMAIFFLLIGLELERELYVGELAEFKRALLPIVAAVGGMTLPAAIHFSLNAGTPTQAGLGIPMATDIAFALAVLAVLGKRIPASLKVFVVAFAVIDDLGAVAVIAVYYTAQLSIGYLLGALATLALLVILNCAFRLMYLVPYLLGGVLMWVLLLKSGVHATLAGVALAFAIPFSPKRNDEQSPSHKLENFLHKPVAFMILPIFALSNAGIVVSHDWLQHLTSVNTLGIAAGLVIGKPLGVTLFCMIAVASGVCCLPSDLRWRHIVGAGILGGIGFTMSIFIANLAFPEDSDVLNASKMAIFLASLAAGLCGFLWLRWCGGAASPIGVVPR